MIGRAAHSLLLLILNNMELVLLFLFLIIFVVLYCVIVIFVTNPPCVEGIEMQIYYVCSGRCGVLHTGACELCARRRRVTSSLLIT